MHLNKLNPGDFFKNFKELSEFVGFEQAPAGNSKKHFLKELSAFCEFEKQGHSYKITQIFDEKLEILDKRKYKATRLDNSTKGIYKNDLQQMILHLLSNSKKDEKVHFTINDFLIKVGLLSNKDFNFSYKNKENPKLQIEFYLKTKKKQKLLLENALKDLASKSFITYDKKYFVILNTDDSNYSHSELANSEHLYFIEKAEKNALEFFGFSQKNVFFKACPTSINEFFSRCNYEISRLSNNTIESFYQGYELLLLKNGLNLTELEFKNLKSKFNNKRTLKLIENLNTHNEIIKKIYDSKYKVETENRDFTSKYLHKKIETKYKNKYHDNSYSNIDKNILSNIIYEYFEI